jgi:hypothetical protein
MNTYYYSGSSDEIETILRNGFTDNLKQTESTRSGVYITDAPGEPDPDYPGDQLLEITLPAEIDCSRWKLVFPNSPADWQEWLIPARVLNKHARVRQLRKDQWEQAWAKYKDAQELKVREDLVVLGFLEHAKDSQGQPIYGDGKPVWRLTEKGRSIKPEDFEAELEAALKAAQQKGYCKATPNSPIAKASRFSGPSARRPGQRL